MAQITSLSPHWVEPGRPSTHRVGPQSSKDLPQLPPPPPPANRAHPSLSPRGMPSRGVGAQSPATPPPPPPPVAAKKHYRESSRVEGAYWGGTRRPVGRAALGKRSSAIGAKTKPEMSVGRWVGGSVRRVVGVGPSDFPNLKVFGSPKCQPTI